MTQAYSWKSIASEAFLRKGNVLGSDFLIGAGDA
jgi:hypothetical protein